MAPPMYNEESLQHQKEDPLLKDVVPGIKPRSGTKHKTEWSHSCKKFGTTVCWFDKAELSIRKRTLTVACPKERNEQKCHISPGKMMVCAMQASLLTTLKEKLLPYISFIPAHSQPFFVKDQHTQNCPYEASINIAWQRLLKMKHYYHPTDKREKTTLILA